MTHLAIYEVTLRAGKSGRFVLRLAASSAESASARAQNIEMCPERSILNVRKVKELST